MNRVTLLIIALIFFILMVSLRLATGAETTLTDCNVMEGFSVCVDIETSLPYGETEILIVRPEPVCRTEEEHFYWFHKDGRKRIEPLLTAELDMGWRIWDIYYRQDQEIHVLYLYRKVCEEAK